MKLPSRLLPVELHRLGAQPGLCLGTAGPFWTFCLFLGLLCASSNLSAANRVIGWNSPIATELSLPSDATNVVAVVGGYDYGLALNSDGRVAEWIWNNRGGAFVVAGVNNAIAVSAGYQHSLALNAERTASACTTAFIAVSEINLAVDPTSLVAEVRYAIVVSRSQEPEEL